MSEIGLINSRCVVVSAMWVVALLLFGAPGRADPIEQQIAASIAAAQAAEQLDEAEALLDQASARLAESGIAPGGRQMRMLKAVT